MNIRCLLTGLLFSLFLAFSLTVQAKPTDEAITIYSDGIKLGGNLWRPAGLAVDEKRPALLMMHGWGGLKSHLNQAYAPQFSELGYVVLTFDYTGWGESEGVLIRTGARPSSAHGAEQVQTYTTEVQELRRVVNPLEQMDDIRAAFAYLSTHANVDANRIAVWGSSLGGGLAVATAVEFPQIKVLITQVGSVNPQAGFTDSSPDNPLSPTYMANWRGAIARGEAPSFPSEATPGLQGYPDWPDFLRYQPLDNLAQLKAATLIIDAVDEALFDNTQNGAELYARIKNQVPARYKSIPGKHYDIYQGTGYQAALALETAWLTQYLPITNQ
jgi:dienelactone hydrolase